jgi:hypothetical protein
VAGAVPRLPRYPRCRGGLCVGQAVHRLVVRPRGALPRFDRDAAPNRSRDVRSQ